MTAASRPKVLVSAFAFSPIKGSEFASGWDYVRAIAAHNQVWVITRSNERKETEEYLQQHPDVIPGLTVHYVPWTSMRFNFPLWEIRFTILYRSWQQKVYRLARDLHSEIHFDLIHHVGATGFREPGYLWKIDAPFVWGPVGGLQYFPVNLLNAIPWRSRPFVLAKNVSTYLAMRSRRPKMAAARASIVIAGTSESADRIQTLWGKKAHLLCEVSAPECASTPPERRLPEQKFRIIWSGNFKPLKTLNIVLLALGKLRTVSSDWEILCLGDGPCEGSWKKLARALDIADHCRFLGRLPRAEALRVMASGHCLVQPSLYDATSNVLVEALAMGLPVVCLDHFGFRDAIDSSCGIRIPAGTLNQVVNDFANALQRLVEDENLRHALAIGARNASTRLTWRYKANVLSDLYSQVMAANVHFDGDCPVPQATTNAR